MRSRIIWTKETYSPRPAEPNRTVSLELVNAHRIAACLEGIELKEPNPSR
jgi:hypothetical protein